jgi:phage nucleotide-binding protein
VATATKTSNSIREKLEVKSPAEAIEYLNMLVYGEPGVGKTYFAATAQDSPHTTPVLFLDVEGGTTTIRRRKDVDVKRVKSIDDLVAVHKLLHDENEGYYKTCVIDSLTELQKLDMRDIMRELMLKRPDLDPDVPGMREWGKSAEHMRRIVRGFRDLPMNTVMTALSNVERDENGVVTFTPSMPGKLKMEVPGFMDIVGYMSATIEEGEPVRRIQFAKTRRVIAKDRTDSLEGSIDFPTIPLLWETITANA